MIEMSKEIRQAVRASSGQPVQLAAPETNEEYVVVSVESYNQLQRLFYDDNPLTRNEQQNLLTKAGVTLAGMTRKWMCTMISIFVRIRHHESSAQ